MVLLPLLLDPTEERESKTQSAICNTISPVDMILVYFLAPFCRATACKSEDAPTMVKL